MTPRVRSRGPHPTGVPAGARRPARVLAAWLGLALLGCASPPKLALSPEELRAELRRRVADLPPEDAIVPWEVGPEAVALARSRLAAIPETADRGRALADLLRSEDGFGLRYEWATTDTAAGTLARGAGNCMALSSVLIGLARGLGLSAYYLEVLVADPTRRDDTGVAVYADHLAAVIDTREGRLFVDYSGELPYARAVRPIGDLEAVAHYFNNRGYELVHRASGPGEVPWESAASDFELATRVDPAMARAWNNLGVARVRLGDDVGARTAYERAIRAAAGFRSPHVNLAMLLMRTGEPALAREHLEWARRLDPEGEHPSAPADAADGSGALPGPDGNESGG